MSRFLFFALLVLGLVWWLRRGMRPEKKEEELPPPPQGRVENMVRCHRCGLHFPEKEAVRRGGRTYCCENHAK